MRLHFWRFSWVFGILCGVACYWSLRLAWADCLAAGKSAESLGRAVRLAPGNAAYWVRWADLLEQSAEPESLSHLLESAAARKPWDAYIWMQMGLQAEMRRDFGEAERYLLEAARVSRQFLPRWTLANYYFRRKEAEPFWRWAREALAISYGDATPVFRLCWSLGEDADTILQRAIPEERRVLGQYLWFLVSENRLSAAAPVARKLAERASAEERPYLLVYCERVMERPEALEMWNAMCARKLVPYGGLDPERGVSLTNGEFRFKPVAGGFDWRLQEAGGISVVQVTSPGYLKLSFSGKQPESCEPVVQFVPLAAGRSYALRFEYRVSGIAPESGLRWRVFDAGSPQLASAQWKEETVFFAAPAGARLGRLALSYQRAPGTTRIEGSVWLRNIRLGFRR